MTFIQEKMEGAKLYIRKQWGWVVTVSAFIVFFALFGFLYSYGIIFVALKEDLGSSASPTSWVGSIAIGFHTLGSLVSNPLIARFGARPIAAIGLVMCFASLLITSFMPSIMPMFFTFSALYGFGINMVLISSINLILKYFPYKNCSRATSMALIGTTSGMLAMNLFIYYLVTRFGWRNMFRIMAGIILALGVPSISTYSQPPRAPTQLDEDEKKKPVKAVEVSAAAKAKEAEAEGLMSPTESNVKSTEVRMDDQDVKVQIPGKPVSRSARITQKLKVLTFPELWFLALGLMGCAMTMSFYYVSMVNFMTTAGIVESKCALIMAVVAIAEVCGKACLAIFGDHLPFPKIYLFVAASVVGSGIMYSLFVAKTVAAMMCVAVVTGFLIMTVFDALPYSICNQVFGAARSVEACTVILVANGLGLILGSLFGESVDKTGSYDDAIYASIGIYVGATVLFCLVPIYQRCFASDRYIMARTKPKVVDEFEAMGPFESWIFMPPAIESTVHLDYESSV
ncbi:monocarboxylate transporter 2-like [Lytechinus variegatus]|uniref:monocarboxylate transporter 2-like n=1 Tax=Lytechinus variegatus TaxID=7654 RepID=UPI001BB0DEC9|nr:monocarboxylate transporter 2-like [Lytechinus variegatus]